MEHFGKQTVKMDQVKKMDTILKSHGTELTKEHSDSGFDIGIQNWSAYCEQVIKKFAPNAQRRDQITELKDKLELAGMSRAGQHTIIDGRVDIDNFKSVYVSLLAYRTADGKHSCCYVIHTLDFKFGSSLPGLTLDQAAECKDEFMKNRVLMKLKQQGRIHQINYV